MVDVLEGEAHARALERTSCFISRSGRVKRGDQCFSSYFSLNAISHVEQITQSRKLLHRYIEAGLPENFILACVTTA